jgi:hypothetical protein
VEGFCGHGNEHSGFTKCSDILELMSDWALQKKVSAPISLPVCLLVCFMSNLTKENLVKVVFKFPAGVKILEVFRK